jgi:hypothetical protein
VRGAGGGLLTSAVAAAAAVHVVRDHVPWVRRHPAVRAGVRCRPAGQAGQQRHEREAAADLLQLVLHGDGDLHRGRVHCHRVHPAGQGMGRRLRRARRAHGHRARAVPHWLDLLPQGTHRSERDRRARTGARRQLQEPPRALAARHGRLLLLLQQTRVQGQDSHEDVTVPEPGVRAREPGQQGAHPRLRAVRPVETVHGTAGGEREGRRPRVANLVDGDHARRDHRAEDVARAADEHDGAAGGSVRDPRGLFRRLQHPHAHRLDCRVRPRIGASSVATDGPRAQAQPAPAHGPRPRALRRGHGRGRAAAIAEGLRDFGPHSGRTVHMSAMRLVPQHCLTGLADALNLIGQIEFFYAEFPKTMSSIGVSLLALGMGFGAVLGSAIVGVIGAATKRDGARRRMAGEQPQQGALRLLLPRPHGAVRGQRGVLHRVRLAVRRGGAEQSCGGPCRGRCPGRAAAAQSDD